MLVNLDFEVRSNIDLPTYGLDIYATKVEDSSLISVKRAFDNYPNIKDIDGLINQLKLFAANNGGVIKNYPMLNIHMNDDNKYEAMVAIPLLRDIAVKGDVMIKKMILIDKHCVIKYPFF